MQSTDVAIIGAGPSGAIAAALLRKHGLQVTVLEQSHFPRFSIGESLLPQCMVFVEEAGLLGAVNDEQFQYKDGAVFARSHKTAVFDFSQKFTPGPFSTFQVPRGRFDQVLALGAQRAGADLRFGHKITTVDIDPQGKSVLTIDGEDIGSYQLQARFLLDASGFGRVLPRFLGLDRPSNFPSRRSVFTHIKDGIQSPDHDRDKILIVIHPEHQDVWYWLIPFSGGRCSIGVVAEPDFLDTLGNSEEQILRTAIDQSPDLNGLLTNAEFDTEVRSIIGYSCDVSTLAGPGFALLGNAGEFLDPVFSSGVTIAMKSASLAVPLVQRQLQGNEVDWEQEYAQPLKTGVNTFRAYVEGWYDGSFQDAIFATEQDPKVREMVCSILAGYAWDDQNPFVAQPKRRLAALAQLCRVQQ